MSHVDRYSRYFRYFPLYLLGAVWVPAACSVDAEVYRIQSGRLSLEFDSLMHSRLETGTGETGDSSRIETAFAPSEFVVVQDASVTDFVLADYSTKETMSLLGRGMEHTLVGESEARLAKRVEVTVYEDFPDMLSFRVTYTNNRPQAITISKWVNNAYSLVADEYLPAFWSYQGASYSDRRDWVQPLDVGFSQDNYMGMNASDYGSGTPVVDVWRRDVGVAVGHLETVPKLVSLPVRYEDRQRGAEFAVEYEYDFELASGESLTTFETFVFVHEGDYYPALKNYRQVMARKGLTIDEVPDSAYESIWCAWGYERNFTVEEVTNTLPKVKELGLEWAVLDDGWQTAEGDWHLDPEKFPNGDADMQRFVQEINDAGLKAKLWWAPLAVDPGTDLLREHEDLLLLNEDGSPQDITWWDSYYMCPAYDKTITHTKEQVTRYMKHWGYRGLKIDGQHLNGVPRCYNPKHNHERPEESVEKLQAFWREVYDTALSIDKEAVVEICPCGTSYSFFNLPHMNQSVSSDPLSSWQVRLKGKTLKALAGESAAYYGDHVELSDDQSDFASSLGIGAVVGTKFTLPSDNPAAAQYLLSAEKEAVWSKWIGLYNDKMLPKGEYLGELYDIGFDRPETHAIRKDGSIFYAFYADVHSGEIELRGLEAGEYRLVDYVANKDMGVVDGPTASIHADFERYLLIEAKPVQMRSAEN